MLLHLFLTFQLYRLTASAFFFRLDVPAHWLQGLANRPIPEVIEMDLAIFLKGQSVIPAEGALLVSAGTFCIGLTAIIVYHLCQMCWSQCSRGCQDLLNQGFTCLCWKLLLLCGLIACSNCFFFATSPWVTYRIRDDACQLFLAHLPRQYLF